MAKWISVDDNQNQITYLEDTSFPFGIYMDEYQKMDGHKLPCHWHSAFEYELVLSGKVNIQINDETITLSAGECVFINSGTLHSGMQISTSEDAVVCAVCFSPDLFTRNVQSSMYQKYFQPLFGKGVHGFKIDCGSAIGSGIHDTLCWFSEINKDMSGYELRVLSKVSNLWLDTVKYIDENLIQPADDKENYSRQKETIKILLSYVHENYAKDLSVDTLTSYAHISRSECFRCFNHYTGKTPFAYINDYRLSQAEHLLRTSSLSIIDVCLSCGFSSQSYFGKMFKRRYGISPSKYRRNHN